MMDHQQKSIVVYSSDDSDDNDEKLDCFNVEKLIIKEIIDRLLLKVEKYHSKKISSQLYRKQICYDSNESNDDDNFHDENDENLSSWSIDESDDECENNICTTKGELTFDDLPKIERLNIYSPIEQLTQIGTVSSVVNQLVIIQSFTTENVLDLDSTLFLKDGSPLGQIFDVIGPVKQPNYVVRFNSIKEIREMNITINMAVYYNQCFPEPYTRYVFVNNLLQQKGCDASWQDNNEPPPEYQDYSDDEKEREARWKYQSKSRQIN